MKHLIYCALIALLLGCGSGNEKKSEIDSSGNQKDQTNGNHAKQLNITLLLDLSDRIDPKTNPEKPEHHLRDIAIIKHFTEVFANDMEKRGAFMAKGKMKVIFSPKPSDPNINIIAEKLNVDLSKMDNKQKKDIYDSLTSVFTENASKIYNQTISQGKWIGSDIWRFFKNDVKDYCVEASPDYRNILVILTDGYIFHEDSKDQSGNRYAYLLPENIERFKLRKNSNWEQELQKQDFGLITKRSDLENLEVLVLEISPSNAYKNDEDIIKSVLSKWFKEMKVKRFALFNSDLPEYTKSRIDDFVK